MTVRKETHMTNDTTDTLDLDHIKQTVNWDHLAELHSDTLKDINSQILLVTELRKQYAGPLPDDIDSAFTGLDLSFKDLIRETITAGVLHAAATNTVPDPAGGTLEYATTFDSGVIDDDDQALTYINVCSKYLNIQDKTANLIALGWVDLFTKLKIPTTELKETIATATGDANATIH